MTDNPLVAQAHSSITWHTGLGLVEDATQVSNGVHDNHLDGRVTTVTGPLEDEAYAAETGFVATWRRNRA